MIPVEFVLKASTAGFRRAMASAENQVSGLRKSMQRFGGAQLGSAIGIFGIVRGFGNIMRAAQDARSEMEKMDQPITEATASVARLADGFDSLKSSVTRGGIAVLGVFTGIGDSIRRTLQGITKEEELAAIKLAEITGKAADEQEAALKKMRAENSPEKLAAAEKKLADFKRDQAISDAEGVDKINLLLTQQMHLQNQLLDLGSGTVARREKELEIAQTTARIMAEEKKLAEDRAKAEEKRVELEGKRATAAANVEEARAALREQVLGDALPSLQQAAAAGGTLGGKARKVLQLEEFAARARGQGASGFESAVKFSTQAAELRESLRGRIGGISEDNLTADLSKALKTAEGELATISSKLDGIFKAQP